MQKLLLLLYTASTLFAFEKGDTVDAKLLKSMGIQNDKDSKKAVLRIKRKEIAELSRSLTRYLILI